MRLAWLRIDAARTGLHVIAWPLISVEVEHSTPSLDGVHSLTDNPFQRALAKLDECGVASIEEQASLLGVDEEVLRQVRLASGIHRAGDTVVSPSLSRESSIAFFDPHMGVMWPNLLEASQLRQGIDLVNASDGAERLHLGHPHGKEIFHDGSVRLPNREMVVGEIQDKCLKRWGSRIRLIRIYQDPVYALCPVAIGSAFTLRSPFTAPVWGDWRDWIIRQASEDSLEVLGLPARLERRLKAFSKSVNLPEDQRLLRLLAEIRDGDQWDEASEFDEFAEPVARVGIQAINRRLEALGHIDLTMALMDTAQTLMTARSEMRLCGFEMTAWKEDFAVEGYGSGARLRPSQAAPLAEVLLEMMITLAALSVRPEWRGAIANVATVWPAMLADLDFAITRSDYGVAGRRGVARDRNRSINTLEALVRVLEILRREVSIV